MKPSLLILFFFWTSLISAQSINQFDSLGKWHGTWKVYLDKNWKVQEDSSKASYVKFTHFEHGTNIYGTANYKGLIQDKSTAERGKILNGEYKWTDKNGNVRFIEVYENGWPVSLTSYDKNGRVKDLAEYRKPWRAEPHTYRAIRYKEGRPEYYFMRNGPVGWCLYPGAEDGR